MKEKDRETRGVEKMEPSDEPREEDALKKFNEEAAYSLALNISETDSDENVRLAKRMMQVSEYEHKGIAVLVHVFLSEEPNLTNEELAAKVLRELANAHPNRFIKKLAKRMTRRKRGL